MPAPFGGEEDLTPFLAEDDFAETVTFSTSSGDVPITGIFFDVFNEDQGIDSAAQSFLCAESDAAAIREGDQAERANGETFVVRSAPQPDGTGMVQILVHQYA